MEDKRDPEWLKTLLRNGSGKRSLANNVADMKGSYSKTLIIFIEWLILALETKIGNKSVTSASQDWNVFIYQWCIIYISNDGGPIIH